jgi:hypothetical protein
LGVHPPLFGSQLAKTLKITPKISKDLKTYNKSCTKYIRNGNCNIHREKSEIPAKKIRETQFFFENKLEIPKKRKSCFEDLEHPLMG